MHLLLVRHGQSTNNVIDAEIGVGPGSDFWLRRVVDPPLSALGEKQALALAKHLGPQLKKAAEQGRVQMVCSSMLRAMQTAAPLAAAIGVPPLVRPDCIEGWSFFRMDADGKQVAEAGPTSEKVRQQFPTFDTSLLPAVPEPTLETTAQARERSRRVAHELLSAAGSAVVDDAGQPELLVLVAHQDFIGLLTRALLAGAAADGSATEGYWDLNNTATTHVVLLPNGHVRLLHWNRSDHLTEALRSGVAWANLPGCAAAAEWARHGEGGSGRQPLFEEYKVVASPKDWRWPANYLAAALAGAALALATARWVRR